jgi:hypothetical protein
VVVEVVEMVVVRKVVLKGSRKGAPSVIESCPSTFISSTLLCDIASKKDWRVTWPELEVSGIPPMLRGSNPLLVNASSESLSSWSTGIVVEFV